MARVSRTCQRVKWAKTDALHRTHEITLDGSVGRCIENCSNSNVHNESPGNKNGLDHNRITVYVFVFTTNLQIQVVQCCIHLRIHHMSWSPLLFRSFSDFVVYIETTLIFFDKSEEKCQFFDKRGYPVSVVQAELPPRLINWWLTPVYS